MITIIDGKPALSEVALEALDVFGIAAPEVTEVSELREWLRHQRDAAPAGALRALLDTIALELVTYNRPQATGTATLQ